MHNILLLGVGGDVSKGIGKAIRLANLHCQIIGACISVESEGLYLCDKSYICPYADTPEFIPWLIDMCSREHIDIVFTGVEENVWAISKEIVRLQEATNAVFRVSNTSQLEIGGDKLKTCQWLEKHHFPYPQYATSEDQSAIERLLSEAGFPLIAKPRQGKGSNGVFLIKNEQMLQDALHLSNYVIEECIGSSEEEYTVGCYYGLNGELPEPIIMRRKLKHGASWMVEVVHSKPISQLAKQICMEFRPNGPLNIQLRLNEKGEPVPFELNVRFSGTTPMRAHFGFCDVQAMLYESLLHRDISDCFSIRPGIAYRYTEELYLSERPQQRSDSTVVWNKLDG